MDFKKCSKPKCMLWLSGQMLECYVCGAAYHVGCWPKNDFCDICQLMNDSQGFSRLIYISPSQKFIAFPQLNPVLVPPI
jgi:hypothetical protein